MAKTREDYFAMGRDCAREELDGGVNRVNAPYARDGKSWQAQAFWEGYEAEKHRLAASDMAKRIHAQESASAQQAPAHGESWPRAAAEHARILASRIKKGGPDRFRLEASLIGLQRRWGSGKRNVNN